MDSIVIAEDDPRLRDLYVRLLSRLGRVCAFGSAEEALPWLGKARLLVTDLEMPGMGGLALLNHAAAVKPDLATVVVSACPARSGANGLADVVLGKPFEAATLLEVCTRLLKPVTI
ncbi:MAG: response regulator [Candidatus Eremiobacteraeota bacterium]|nr:response regulator [Candidatus Eremiobacteraeota bacterium]